MSDSVKMYSAIDRDILIALPNPAKEADEIKV